MFSLFFTLIIGVTVLDPIEGYPDFTPDISLLEVNLSQESILVRITGIHYHYEDAAYILVYVDTDNDPLTGTHWSKGENPRYLGIGADYMLLNLPDTETWIYRTPSRYVYDFLGIIPSFYDTFPGDTFKVGFLWDLPHLSRVVNMAVFGGSEEFTDDRVPDSGYVEIGRKKPLECISQTEVRVFWHQRR